MSIESASAIYDSLYLEIGTKGIKSLNNIKASCDLIVSVCGIMNYSRVADIATKEFGGPKKQTVQNNKNLKRYIDARILEYNHLNRRRQPKPNIDSSDNSHKYPSDNLDSRTKTYIDQIRTRLNLVEVRYKELRKWQEEYSKINPVNLAAVIGVGPKTNGLMSVEPKQNNDELLYHVRNGIHEFMKLTDYIHDLDIEKNRSMQRLTLKRPMGTHVVLSPKQFEAIEIFLSDSISSRN